MSEAFPFTSKPIPDEVTAVRGCTCGGTLYHRSSEPRCELLELPAEQVQAAVDEAELRIQAHVDEKNRQLRAWLDSG